MVAENWPKTTFMALVVRPKTSNNQPTFQHPRSPSLPEHITSISACLNIQAPFLQSKHPRSPPPVLIPYVAFSQGPNNPGLSFHHHPPFSPLRCQGPRAMPLGCPSWAWTVRVPSLWAAARQFWCTLVSVTPEAAVHRESLFCSVADCWLADTTGTPSNGVVYFGIYILEQYFISVLSLAKFSSLKYIIITDISILNSIFY